MLSWPTSSPRGGRSLTGSQWRSSLHLTRGGPGQCFPSQKQCFFIWFVVYQPPSNPLHVERGRWERACPGGAGGLPRLAVPGVIVPAGPPRSRLCTTVIFHSVWKGSDNPTHRTDKYTPRPQTIHLQGKISPESRGEIRISCRACSDCSRKTCVGKTCLNPKLGGGSEDGKRWVSPCHEMRWATAPVPEPPSGLYVCAQRPWM